LRAPVRSGIGYRFVAPGPRGSGGAD